MMGNGAHAAERFFADLTRLLPDEPMGYLGVGPGRGAGLLDLLTAGLPLRQAWLFEPDAHAARRLLEGDAGDAVEVREGIPEIDAWVEACGPSRIDVLDLAAGGRVVEALRGAHRLLSSGAVGVVSAEVGFVADAPGPPHHRDVEALLGGHGYRLYRYDPVEWDALDEGPVLRRAHALFVQGGGTAAGATGRDPAAAATQTPAQATAERLQRHADAVAGVAVDEVRELIAEVTAQREQLAAQREELDARREELAAQAAAFAARAAEFRNRFAAQVRYGEELEATIAALLASRSWRLTSPVRAASRLGQRLLGQPVSDGATLPARPQAADDPVDGDAAVEAPSPPAGQGPPPAALPPGARFVTTDGRRRKVTLKRARNWLWSGYADLGRTWLEAIVDGSLPTPLEDRLEAARTLSVWHAKREDPATALTWLRRCSELDPDCTAQRPFWMLEAQYLVRAGRLAEARVVVASRGGDPRDTSARLVAATIDQQVDPDAAARWREGAVGDLNAVYAHHGLLPVGALDGDERWSIDNLTTDLPAERLLAAGPLVSVIVPVYNGADTLPTALRSLRQQSWTNLEIIVVDDASDDGSAEVARGFARDDDRFRLVELAENAGVYGARNAGLGVANGEYVTIHDADDWSHAEKIESQLDLIRAGAPFALSDMVRVAEPLVFVGPPTPSDSLLQPNISSTLIRHDDLRALEGWDDRVRITADAELLRRLALRHGLDPDLPDLPRALPGCPLSFLRKTETSLTGRADTHASTVRFGVRREYREASEWWYARRAGDGAAATIPRSDLDFPVPATIRRNRAQRVDTDVLVIADFALAGDPPHDALAMVEGALAAGCRTAVRQYPWWRQYPMRRRLPAAVRERLYRHDVPIAAAHEEVAAEGVLVAHPPLLEHRHDGATTVEARWAALTVDVPAERTREGKQPLYDPQRVADTLEALVPCGTAWVATSEALRRLMDADPRFPAPAPAVWTPLLDLDRWAPRRTDRSRIGHARPVLGRSAREDALAWPAQPDALRSAYGADQPCDVRLLGGAKTLRNVLDELPDNWETLPWDGKAGDDEPLRGFLSTLDFFVGFPHESAIAATDRVTLRAMALGVPVILPPGFAGQFGDAALYAEPDEVWSVVSATWQRPQDYLDRVEAGLAYVRRHCDLRGFGARIAALAG